ncbi:hypothetical protein [Bradyrhizobium sp. RT10b]|uniref:hypothetical protein n=1 Tax=Bradyrhizobium sp. RT10b TaxID=3156331 RepID=UPI00339131AE
MNKPKLHIDSTPPRKVRRADLAPTIGFAIVVDGRFKAEFDDEKAARERRPSWWLGREPINLPG